ncbi:MAG: substrate-binding domain-containing protein, partial [Fimbriimonadaceae bacterium]|nr:substrate-binding domain-containing protein [Fimbriimonadaceae bacterium]
IDGLILSEQSTNERLRLLDRAGMPTVALGRSRNLPPSIGACSGDESAVAEAAVGHLADLGHRRLLMIDGPTDPHASGGDPLSDIAVARGEAFDSAAHRRGLQAERLTNCAWDRLEDADRLIRRLRAEDRPTAVFAANDRIALQVLAILSGLGLEAPRDVSLVGVDNDFPASPLLNSGLTTIDVPCEEIGRQTIACLVRLLAGERIESCRVLVGGASLVERSTTGPAAG